MPSHYHAFGIHDTCIFDAASNVGGYTDTFQVPTKGKVVNLDIRPSQSKETFSDEKVRALVVEMHSIFNECHTRLAAMKKLDNIESLYLSQKYRSVLRSAANVNDPDDQHMRDTTLWAIYECMFLKTGDLPIVLDLLNWAHECFIFCHILAKTATEEYENGMSMDDGSYWKAVVVSLLCLRFDECIVFLRMRRNDAAARLFISHLEQFETEWLHDQTKLPRFLGWQQSLQSLVDTKRFKSNNNVAFLARLLSGEDAIFDRVAQGAILTEWWNMMPFYVFVKYPTAAYNALGPIAEECKAFYNKDVTNEEDLDPFFAVFNLGDISVLQDLVSNPWLSLHLVDTMFCCESYENPIFKIRNHLVESYGATLFVNSNLWEIGVSYLLQCGIQGKLRIESLICSMLIEDEDTAEKLLQICEDHDLEDAKTCIINTMTHTYLREEAWASALAWALRLGQSKTLDLTVNTIVWKASEKEISSLNVINALGDLAHLSPSLSFLLHYYRYFTILYSGDSNQSSQILLGLIGSPDVPSNFHSIMFGQLACILQGREIPISRETIYELITFFKQYSMDHSADADFDAEKVVTLKQLMLMRLAESAVA